MPINLRKAREALRPLAERILEFLSANEEKGFSLYEIIAGLEGYDDVLASYSVVLSEKADTGHSTTHERYRQAIDALRTAQCIQEVAEQGTKYYYFSGTAAGEQT